MIQGKTSLPDGLSSAQSGMFVLWTLSVTANTLWTGGLDGKTREAISAGFENGAAHGFLDMEGLEHCNAPMSITVIIGK